MILSSLGFAYRFVTLKEVGRGKEFGTPCMQIILLIQIMFRHTCSEEQKTTCFIGAAQLLHLLSVLPGSSSERAFHVLIWQLKLAG